MSSTAGMYLKAVRQKMNLGLREVQQFSQQIALEEQNNEFHVSAARLAQIENEGSPPSVYKIFTLSAVYKIDFLDLLKRYGVRPDRVHAYREMLKSKVTHLLSTEVYSRDTVVTIPTRLDPAFRWETTQLINRVVSLWGEIPAALLLNWNPRRHMYGFVGTNDFRMFPLIQPGAVVTIDSSRRRILQKGWASELQRPIYFIELRHGYRCSWCQLDGNRITLIPHPLSPASTETFSFPAEAEVVGQIVGVAMRLADPDVARKDQTAEDPMTVASER
jgi:transcriptional regulator with XRE-family HTH domain